MCSEISFELEKMKSLFNTVQKLGHAQFPDASDEANT